MHEYRAELERIVDGDTVELIIDLGFDPIKVLKSIRFARINAPEDETPEGKEAAKFVFMWFSTHKNFYIKTTLVKGKDKKDSFRRYIADIYCSDTQECLNDVMVACGHAQYKTYSEVADGKDNASPGI